MILVLMLGLAGAAASVADAERAFAAKAARDGQWTAFRATATDDAIMFVPERVNAQSWLRGRADPPKPVAWAPAATATACDGSMAVTIGAFREPDGTTGRFAKVWRRQADGGWKWALDQGAPARVKPPEELKQRVVKPDCANAAKARGRELSPLETLVIMGAPVPPGSSLQAWPQTDESPLPPGSSLQAWLQTDELPLLAHGKSDDATLQWAIRGNQTGKRRLVAWLWDGRSLAEVFTQDVP